MVQIFPVGVTLSDDPPTGINRMAWGSEQYADFDVGARFPCPGRDYGLQCFGIRATGRLFASSGRIPSTNRVSSALCGADRGGGFGTGGLQGDLLPEHYLFGEHRAVRVCSAQPSEGGISGMCEIGRAAFLQGRCAGVGHVLSAGSLWQPERVSGPGNPSESAESAVPSKRGLEKEDFSIHA